MAPIGTLNGFKHVAMAFIFEKETKKYIQKY